MCKVKYCNVWFCRVLVWFSPVMYGAGMVLFSGL